MALSRSTRVNILIGNGHFLSHFYVLCLPTMFFSWREDFGVSFAEVGIAITMMSGVTALMQTPVGFLVDRYGARPFLIGGTLIMSLSVATMGLATEFWQILLLAALSGLGNSVVHPADYAILSGSVDKDRMGRAFALHTFSGNVGFASGPPVTAALIAALGWRGALLTVGLVGVPVVVAILLQSRILVDQTRPAARPAAAAGSGWRLLSSRTMVLFFLFFMCGAMASGGVQAWLVVVLTQSKGIEFGIASVALTTYMVGSTMGVLVGGYIADSLKQFILPWVVGLTMLSALTILSINWLPLPGLVIVGMTFLSGLALGSSRTPRDIMLKDAAPPGQIGKVFGFVSAGLPLGSAITPAPLGFLIDHGMAHLVLVFVAMISILSLLCAGSARMSARNRPAVVAAE
jgi:predicted MFS family arabinose efflux permease